MKDERNERAKEIGWVSVVVDVGGCSHFPLVRSLTSDE